MNFWVVFWTKLDLFSFYNVELKVYCHAKVGKTLMDKRKWNCVLQNNYYFEYCLDFKTIYFD